ncbi:MAG: hypothetical protein ACJAS4_002760 [Bacteriovoracaceae bacterium]|jgi:hypothetical protein
MNLTKLSVLVLPLVVGNIAHAAKCNVDLNLKEFKKNPKAFLNAPVPKRDSNCGKKTFSYFDKSMAESKDFVEIKDQARANLCHTDKNSGQKVCLKDIKPGADVQAGRAPIEGLDRAENLITGDTVIKNVFSMEDFGLREGSAEIKPWSDWYWPIAVGQLSYRYADNNMKNAFSNSGLEGEKMWSFMQEWHAKSENSPLLTDINLLSPAEKYDILVGDSNFTLTNFMLKRPGDFSQKGKVATWMGICHGWSPASYMLPRPVKEVIITAADGVTDITFRPTDLKALGSQLWAAGAQSTKMVGGRCNIKNPKTDRNGRILDQNCFDNNPGTWHTTIVNQLGKNKLSFVMDATYDIEVWNHPVTSYSYSYFNPESMEEYNTLKEAIVSIRDFRTDKFKKYRSKEASAVVGIKMEVEYLVETMPNTFSYDESTLDAHNRAYYVYDLELDTNYNIVGGEWYTNKHPDFLWTPYEDSHATSNVDSYIRETVSVKNMASIDNLSRLAQRASGSGQPIGKVVEALLEAASVEERSEGTTGRGITLEELRRRAGTDTRNEETTEATTPETVEEVTEETEAEVEEESSSRGSRIGRFFRRIFG